MNSLYLFIDSSKGFRYRKGYIIFTCTVLCIVIQLFVPITVCAENLIGNRVIVDTDKPPCGNSIENTKKPRKKLLPFIKGRKWGYVDEQGRVVIAPQFVIAHEFSQEGIAAVADKESWAYINTKGEVVIRPVIFDNGPDYFREGLARYIADGKIGFFDKTGKIIIEAKFDFAQPFHEELAAVCMGCKEVLVGEHKFMQGGKWGYINRKGDVIISPKFDRAFDFENEQARVKFSDRSFSIDKSGKEIPNMLDIFKEIEEIDAQAYQMAEKVVREPSLRNSLADKANSLAERLDSLAEELERTYPDAYIKISDQISEAILDLSFVEMDSDIISFRLRQVIEAENLRRK